MEGVSLSDIHNIATVLALRDMPFDWNFVDRRDIYSDVGMSFYSSE